MSAAVLEDFLRKVADAEGMLSFANYREVADRFSLSYGEVERVILESGFFPLRYQRQRALFGNLNQLRLLKAKVAIVGCGGLGGAIFEMLIRLGVGHLLVIDPDFFVESNLNRQFLATLGSLGRNKVEVALERGKEVNPALNIDILNQVFQSAEGELMLSSCDLVFDALDSISARLELARLCSRHNLILIHGAVAGWYGQTATIVPGSEKMTQIYPESSSDSSEQDSTSGVETELGNLVPTINMVASLQVAAGLKYLFKSDFEGQLMGCFVDLSGPELELLI
ncbi:HesA/MoeB/ThiF family protein [bacterium]|nr:HesA/MoeB/ThiF family protein [bacterium]